MTVIRESGDDVGLYLISGKPADLEGFLDYQYQDDTESLVYVLKKYVFANYSEFDFKEAKRK